MGKMRAKCLYYPRFVVEVVDIGTIGDALVNLSLHAGKDGWFTLN